MSKSLEGFDNTKSSLETLLRGEKNFTDDYLQESIESYLAACERKAEFDWTYYYMKYSEFRPPRYGKYFRRDMENEPYYVECENDSYVVKNLETGAIEDRLEINRRDGIDAEDRIKKFSSWAKDYLY